MDDVSSQNFNTTSKTFGDTGKTVIQSIQSIMKKN